MDRNGYASNGTGEGRIELTEVGYTGGVGPRWWWMKCGRGSGGHAAAGGAFAGVSGCPR